MINVTDIPYLIVYSIKIITLANIPINIKDLIEKPMSLNFIKTTALAIIYIMINSNASPIFYGLFEFLHLERFPISLNSSFS